MLRISAAVFSSSYRADVHAGGGSSASGRQLAYSGRRLPVVRRLTGRGYRSFARRGQYPHSNARQSFWLLDNWSTLGSPALFQVAAGGSGHVGGAVRGTGPYWNLSRSRLAPRDQGPESPGAC